MIDFKIEFDLGMSPSEYIDKMIELVDKMTRNFIVTHHESPDVLYLDWRTYKKLELATKYATVKFDSLYQYSSSCTQEYFMGLKIEALPIQAELITLGFNRNDRNVSIGMFEYRNEVE